MKKFFLLTIMSFVITAPGFSQAKPSYTQYILNNYILNPAVAGIENYVDVKLNYRNQWTSIPGAPKTAYFSIQGPIGKPDLRTSATSMPVHGENPRGKNYWKDYSTPAAHHGLGAVIMNDKAGYINRWSIYATYAYHKPLGSKTTLAAGFNLGISSVNLDRSKIDFASLNPDDPAIGYTSGELKKVKPELGAGLWLYSDKYFAGMSVLNIIPGKSRFVKNETYGVSFTPNYFLTAGYRILLSEDWNLIPSVMVQYWKPQLTGVHFNAKLQYTDLLWLGGSYRYSDLVGGYSAMIGLNVANINASYSYEVSSNSRLRTYTGNTHEIMVGFLIGNKYGDTCPRNIW